MEQVETKVDVMAVWDDVIDHATNKPERNCGTLCGLRLEDSRAAIAELIEAANRAHMALIGYLPAHRNAVTDEAITKVSAALARVSGGAA